ncbi:putative transporter YwrA [Paenibacillus baekrokdamisoli]|uniref:Putative transporter YwrA n=1 Tax=Paenibacillus baekrokdamisoli TaxID=1712516 RepID=A0A3G9JNM6_9BACL|nr:chromate transporter [Paenibacillus baekrokdamisoli]MBB3071505.1 chromate transporter [Paenibacillus baekrokdamisoli]BBH24464.1 putative transporter YwrA [Paenibacillus baekrokdamisoli]
MWSELLKLFVSFGRATMLGYGGGPSIIPLYENEVVSRMKWMTTEDFGHALAFGNSLPGPIATKLAAYIGFKVAGWPGATIALAAVVLPTALLMILLVGLMSKLQNNTIIKGMIRGIQPVIFVMMAMLAYDFAKFALKTSPGVINFIPFLLAAGYFILVNYLNVNAVYGIVGSLVIGALFLRG